MSLMPTPKQARQRLPKLTRWLGEHGFAHDVMAAFNSYRLGDTIYLYSTPDRSDLTTHWTLCWKNSTGKQTLTIIDPNRNGPTGVFGITTQDGKLIIDDQDRIVLLVDEIINPLIFEINLLHIGEALAYNGNHRHP